MNLCVSKIEDLQTGELVFLLGGRGGRMVIRIPNKERGKDETALLVFARKPDGIERVFSNYHPWVVATGMKVTIEIDPQSIFFAHGDLPDTDSDESKLGLLQAGAFLFVRETVSGRKGFGRELFVAIDGTAKDIDDMREHGDGTAKISEWTWYPSLEPALKLTEPFQY